MVLLSFLVVMGETKLFENVSQLNQLLRKMISCFEALETPYAAKKHDILKPLCLKEALFTEIM